MGVNSVQNYFLCQNVHFDIDARSSKVRYVDIVLKSNLDREKKAEHSLILTGVDGGNPPRSGSLVIQIFVQDVNDNAPSLYRAQLFENAARGTAVIKILGIDEDEGVNGQLTYYINHLSDSTKDLFQINEQNGKLLVTGKLDHETASTHEIEIQAEDGGGQTGHSKIVIEILDVNDNAPVITVKSLMNPIPENIAVGSEVGILNVKTADSVVLSPLIYLLIYSHPSRTISL